MTEFSVFSILLPFPHPFPLLFLFLSKEGREGKEGVKGKEGGKGKNFLSTTAGFCRRLSTSSSFVVALLR
jgi:hypothetical protein